MFLRRHRVFLLLAVAGCNPLVQSFDLKGTGLTIASPFLQVAPREKAQLAPTGGQKPYSFSFAPSPNSGPDATLDPLTGAYQAGSLGSTQDAIQIADANGNFLTVHAAVGAALSVSPASSNIAPGGGLVFAASGGKPPYVFALSQSGSGAPSIDASGHYRAGAIGDAVDTVSVTDGTGDAKVVASATVSVTKAVTLIASADLSQTVAPFDSVSFVAVGGQAPYAFSVSASSGSTIGTDSGVFVAGSASETDSVVVTDTNGQQAALTVNVGAPLGATFAASVAHPLQTYAIAPTAGRPPYAFAFADKGNHSHGTINTVSGEYTAGASVGVHDTVTVTDATGRDSVTVQIPVGSWRAETPTAARCLTGDIDGDLRDESILLYLDGTNRVTVTSLPLDQPAKVTTFYPPINGTIRDGFVADLNNDRHADLVLLTDLELVALLSDASGHLSQTVSISRAGSPPDDSWATPFAVALMSNTFTFFFVDYGSGPCGGTGFDEVHWTLGTAAFSATTCFFPEADVEPTALVAGNFNGDSFPDLGWTETNATGLQLSFGKAGGSNYQGFSYLPLAGGTNSNYLFPGPLTYSASGLSARPFSGGPDDQVLAAYSDGDLDYNLAVLNAGTWTPDPGSNRFTPAVGHFDGMAAFQPTPFGAFLVNTWSHASASIGQFSIDELLNFSAPTQFDTTQPNVFCASTPDINGDGLPDLMTVGGGGQSEFAFGEGDGRFGVRPRLGGIAGHIAALGDIDGDGIKDFVAITPAPSVQVYLSEGSELAFSDETPLAAVAAVVGHFTGTAFGDVLLANTFGGLTLAAGAATGALATPVALTDANNGTALSTAWSWIATAELGGSAPGPDLIALQSASDGHHPQFDAIIRNDNTTATVVPITLPAGCALGTVAMAADLNNDGIDEIVVECSNGNLNAVYSTVVVRLVGSAFVADAPFATTFVTAQSPTPLGMLAGQAIWIFDAPANAGYAAVSNSATTVTLFGIGQLITAAVLGDLDHDQVPDVFASLSDGTHALFTGDASAGLTLSSNASGLAVRGQVAAIVPSAGSYPTIWLAVGSLLVPINTTTGIW